MMHKTHRFGFTRVELFTTRKGFTLVELLVVVAILVVLIAMLLPAMERATYQTELVVCGTRMKGTTQGVTTYAMDFKRFYPQRDVIDKGATAGTSFESQPIVLAWDGYDDRAKIAPYVPMKSLVEAAAPAISIGIEEVSGRVFAGYSLYFGMRFVGATSGMRRMGDHLTYTDARTGNLQQYALLAADFDFVSDVDRHISSHPDSLNVIPVLRYYNDPNFGTFSRYDNFAATPLRRGTLDLNYAYANGAVVRANGIEVNDDRTASVAYRADNLSYPAYRVQLYRE